jgi:spore maturation protein CgeB
MRLLFVIKKAPYDPSQKALRRLLPKYFDFYAEFKFHKNERLRFSEDNKLFSSRFRKMINDFQPTHIFCWILYLNADEVDWCKQKGIRIIVAINGAASFSTGIQKSQRIYFDTLKKCDYYLIPHAPHIDTLKKHGINSHEMPFFYDDNMYKPLKNYYRLWDIFLTDIFFIGNIGLGLSANKQGEYRKDLLSLLGKNFNIKVMSDLKRYENKIAWRRPTFNERIINWHQNRSKIILCMDYFPDINSLYSDMNDDVVQTYHEEYYYFIRPRTFYSMASGVPVVSEKHSQIERFFKDGENIILWESDNIVEKIDYYLNHIDKLNEIGAAGLETVQTLHTVNRRMTDVIIPALSGDL